MVRHRPKAPSGKRVGARKFATVKPWGKLLGVTFRSGGGSSGGSSRRPSKPDASLAPQTKGYPKNKPSQWPVEPDVTTGALPPSTSGLNSTSAANHNIEVERAFTRAGYQ
jgi:hypothetical protein